MRAAIDSLDTAPQHSLIVVYLAISRKLQSEKKEKKAQIFFGLCSLIY